MPKFRVYGIMTASSLVGEYEVETKEKVIEKVEKDKESDWYRSLCHQCAGDIELGEIYELQAEEI